MRDTFLIMGPPAAGKSTVAQALMRRFTRGVHIPVDDVRHMVVSGLVDMSFEFSDELLAQLALAHEAAALMARTYTRGGFTAALDDFWFGAHPEADYARVLGPDLHLVLLRPQRAAALARLSARGTDGDSFRPLLEQAIAFVDDELERHPKTGWHVIDSTRLTVEETVDAILHATGVQPR
ncbi:AAA family ATPase [Deinococcus depolymerans]|uniref:Phosphotransferase n=1 Tax=Deinococcus depolymerans TaxID=392408 RepID=A0ABP3LZ82_9DEIO